MNFENIIRSGELFNQLKIQYNKIHAIGYTTRNLDEKIFHLPPDQYPGVYFQLINKDLFNDEIKIEKDEIVLVFCPDLLKRKDFHFNKYDRNGFLNPNNTIFSHELENYLNDPEFRLSSLNEVVFHNPVSIKYIKQIWTRTYYMKKYIEDLLSNYNIDIPVSRNFSTFYRNTEIPNCDITKKYSPNYCFFFDLWVPGTKYGELPFEESWYQNMSSECGIKNAFEKTKDELFDEMENSVFESGDLEQFKLFLVNQGVTRNFMQMVEDDILINLMNYMNIVDLKHLVEFSKYNFP